LLPSLQPHNALNDSTIVKGLKEALATGTERAMITVGKPDGYLGNQLIKILLPEKMVAEEGKKIRTNPAARTTDLLRRVFGGK